MDLSIRRRGLIVRGATMVVVMWIFIRLRRMTSHRRGAPCLLETKRGQQRFSHDSDDTGCVELLRMKRAPFFQLCDLFRTRGLLRDSIISQIKEQVAMFLLVVGHNTRFRVIKHTFRRSTETISSYFQEVLYVVGELRNEIIVSPASSVHPKI